MFKDKDLVSCKRCDGKGIKNIILILVHPCDSCNGSGLVEWIKNIVSKKRKRKNATLKNRSLILENIIKLETALKEEFELLGEIYVYDIIEDLHKIDESKDINEEINIVLEGTDLKDN